MLRFLAGFLACVWLTTASAAVGPSTFTIDPRVAKEDVCGTYHVVHINGINTNQTGAFANLQAIIDLYGNSHDEHLIVYDLAYNQTRGFAQDVIDTYRQIAQLYPPVTFTDYINAIWTGIVSAFWPPDIIEMARQAITAPNQEQVPIYEQDLRSMVLALRPHVGWKMVMVGHSQGTLYANMLYDRLLNGYSLTTGGPGDERMGAQSMAILAIAAVTQDLRRGLYITSGADSIVNSVRALYPRTLAANAGNLPAPDGGLGHNFRSVYMAYVGYAIKKHLNGMLMSVHLKGNGQPTPAVYADYGYFADVKWSEPFPPDRLEPSYWYYAPVTLAYVLAMGASLEDAKAKAIENSFVCLPLMIEFERRRRLGNPIPYPWVPGCWTNQEALYQAWRIYSSDGPPQAITTEWNRYDIKVVGKIGYTCKVS